MICIYEPTCTDFTTNGLGQLIPSSCEVTETLNGEYELKLVHPLDEAGKWSRLIEDRIIKAPVPASMTPYIRMHTESSSAVYIYRVSTSAGIGLRLSTGKSLDVKIIGLYDSGMKVIVTVLQEAYKGSVLKNSSMTGELLVLKPGATAISWTGSVTKVVIQPNWRYL